MWPKGPKTIRALSGLNFFGVTSRLEEVRNFWKESQSLEKKVQMVIRLSYL